MPLLGGERPAGGPIGWHDAFAPTRPPAKVGGRVRGRVNRGEFELVEIVLEPNVRRRRGRQPLSGKKKAAALFRVWHGVRELIEQAEKLGDSELVHFLAVTQLLVEERATTLTSGVTAFEHVDTSLPN
jgi:hypothetical protein